MKLLGNFSSRPRSAAVELVILEASIRRGFDPACLLSPARWRDQLVLM